MKANTLIFISLLLISMFSCKKDEVVDTTPQLAQKIEGVYLLSSLLKSGNLANVTSTASGIATITAKNNSNATIKYSLTVGNVNQEVTTDYTITQNGNDYLVKDKNGLGGVVQSNILKMTITFFGPSSPQDYIIEFTK